MNDLKNEMLYQDERHTSFPIFIVVEDLKIFGFDSGYCDGKERQDREQVDYDWFCESCQALEDEDKELPDECDDCDSECFINYRIEKKVPNMRAAFFFTAKACDEHIAANRHHYNETARSYAISACHNDELRNVIEFLKNR